MKASPLEILLWVFAAVLLLVFFTSLATLLKEEEGQQGHKTAQSLRDVRLLESGMTEAGYTKYGVTKLCVEGQLLVFVEGVKKGGLVSLGNSERCKRGD